MGNNLGYDGNQKSLVVTFERLWWILGGLGPSRSMFTKQNPESLTCRQAED